MEKYAVLLTRSYMATIQAEKGDHALRYSEFYLGVCPDLSKTTDRREKKFKIKEREMTF